MTKSLCSTCPVLARIFHRFVCIGNRNISRKWTISHHISGSKLCQFWFIVLVMKETYQILAWLYNYNIKSDVKINFFKFESTLLTGSLYKPACEFWNELLNFATNFRTSQRSLEYYVEKLAEIDCKFQKSLNKRDNY